MLTSLHSCTGCVDPGTWLNVGAGRCGISFDIDFLISEPDSLLVEESERLRKPARLRVARGYGGFDDVEPVLVHVHRGEGSRFVGVCQRQLMSFDELEEVPLILSHFRVPLHELPRCMNKRGSHVHLPPSLTTAGDSSAHDVAGGARLGFLAEYSLNLVVIDHAYRVAALALRDAVDAGRKVGAILRSIGRLRDLRLAREKARETVFAIGKLDPFLGEHGPGNGQHQGGRNQWR